MKLKSKYLFTLMAAVAFCFVSCNDDNTPENPDDSGITENPGDTDGTDEVPHHHLPDLRDHSPGTWGGSVFYRLLPGDEPDGSGQPAGNGSAEDRLCHCAGDRVDRIHSKGVFPGPLLAPEKGS